MTPEAQRVAIAEACGWKDVDSGAGRVWGITTRYVGTPSETSVCVDVPDYLNDLNAMHEVEKNCINDGNTWGDYFDMLTTVCDCDNDPITATAAQRAEAFLRTLNLWKDSTLE